MDVIRPFLLEPKNQNYISLRGLIHFFTQVNNAKNFDYYVDECN